MDWCVVFLPSLKKIATMYSETILFHVMPLQNDRSLSKPLQMGVCSYFLASHASKGLAPDCAGYFLPSIYTFSVSPSCPYEETAIIWFGVLLFPVHS